MDLLYLIMQEKELFTTYPPLSYQSYIEKSKNTKKAWISLTLKFPSAKTIIVTEEWNGSLAS